MERRLSTAEPAPSRKPDLVGSSGPNILSSNELCRPNTQVFRLSGCQRMGERWLVAGRPKLGAFPDSIPATHIHGMVGTRRQYRFCERICVCVPTSVPYSNHSTAYIVRPIYFIDVITKGAVRHQYEVLHVSSQKGCFLPLHRLTFVPFL